jgi:CO dehydrogenase maturation factor
MTGLRLAVVGKGGAGKSFISATLARSLARSGRTVALLDSDALPGAAISLGMGPLSDPMLADAAQETIEGWRLKRGIGPATAIRRYSRTGPDGVRLLQYGKAGDQGLAGMWGSVHAFNMVSKRLARERVLLDWDLIADLAAGSRQTGQNRAPFANRYLVVVGPGAPSMLTARRLVAMARSWGADVGLVGNRVEGRDLPALESLGAPLVAVIPPDEAVARADAEGKAPIDTDPDAPAVRAVGELALALTT